MKVTEVLTREELKEFSRRSDLLGAWTVLFTWGSILAIFALLARWPNPLTIAAALVLLGGRCLALAVIMHDCAHRSLFRTTALNDFFGQWFGGAPIWIDLRGYWRKHSVHHRDAGTPGDPDLANYRDYAIPRSRFARKIRRDLTGVTAYRTLRFILSRGGWRAAVRPLIFNALLLAGLAACGAAWVFLVWVAAYSTTYMLIARVRNAAEHAVVPDLNDPDPRRHTRTTLAGVLERMIIAPNKVNYHLEHHLLPGVPGYRLRRMHRTLAERGFYAEADIAPGYLNVIRRLTVRPEPVPPQGA